MENIMENEKNTSKRLMFLEPVNENSDVENLLERLILKLETLGINVTDEEE
jgi:hypothetical protein